MLWVKESRNVNFILNHSVPSQCLYYIHMKYLHLMRSLYFVTSQFRFNMKSCSILCHICQSLSMNLLFYIMLQLFLFEQDRAVRVKTVWSFCWQYFFPPAAEAIAVLFCLQVIMLVLCVNRPAWAFLVELLSWLKEETLSDLQNTVLLEIWYRSLLHAGNTHGWKSWQRCEFQNSLTCGIAVHPWNIVGH